MTALQASILELFEQLEPNDKRDMIALLQDKVEAEPKLELGEWLKKAAKLREEFAAEYGYVNVQEMLDELREEASWIRK